MGNCFSLEEEIFIRNMKKISLSGRWGTRTSCPKNLRMPVDPWDVQGHVGWGFEHPGIVEGCLKVSHDRGAGNKKCLQSL